MKNRTKKTVLILLSILTGCLFLSIKGEAYSKSRLVTSSKKNISHIQLFHIYSDEYRGKELKGYKVAEFAFARGKSFSFYVTEASVTIKIRSMKGQLLYKKTTKVTRNDFSGTLCHIRIKDSEIRSNPVGQEGVAEISAVLKDGSHIKYGPGKTVLYRLPTSGKAGATAQTVPSLKGYRLFAVHNDTAYISFDAYHSLGSAQGFASDNKGHFLALNSAEPGTKGKYSHLLIYYTLGGKPVYCPINKKNLGHVNDAAWYKGQYFVAVSKKGSPHVYGLKIKKKGKSLSITYKKYKLSKVLKGLLGDSVAGITCCRGESYKGRPVFILRKGNVLYKVSLKKNTFKSISRIYLKNIPGNYTPQYVTYYKGKVYLGYTILNSHGDQTNHFIVGTLSSKVFGKKDEAGLSFSVNKSFKNLKGVEVEGMAVNQGKFYYNFNGLDKLGRQMDFIMVKK